MVLKLIHRPVTIVVVVGCLAIMLLIVIAKEDYATQPNKVKCVDRAAQKGLDFVGRYGKTIADTDVQQLATMMVTGFWMFICLVKQGNQTSYIVTILILLMEGGGSQM